MSVIVRRLFVACVIAACAGSVLLYSGAGPMGPATAMGQDIGWNPVLAFLADLLTLPLATTDIADVRDVVLVAALGAFLVLQFVAVRQKQRAAPAGAGSPSGDALAAVSPNFALRWLLMTGAAVLIISLLSSAGNQSWSISAGWLIRTFAGMVWAVLLARTFDDRMVRQALNGLFIVGAFCILLAIAQRTDRHLVHFQWPIGPITPTATMSAIWFAMAAGGLIGLGWRRSHLGRSAMLASVGALAVYALTETGRRGPALAVLGSALLLVAWNRWQAARRVWARWTIVVLMLAGLGGGAFYVMRQVVSANRVASGSVGVRFEYWRLAWGMIRDRTSLGSGPDTFVAEMTNTVAPLRGVSPHVYHGNMDADAHNEWIQAAVEIGLPGALFWLMLPLGVMGLSWRPIHFESPLIQQGGGARLRFAPFNEPERRSSALALTAGLLVIVIAECSGIMLRGPILAPWYWTLLGLLCAMARVRTPLAAEATTGTRRVRSNAGLGMVASLAGAITCGVVMQHELAGASIDAPREIVENGSPDMRLFAMRTIGLYNRAAEYASFRAASAPNPATREAAVVRWRRLYEIIPGWSDTPARYAAALYDAGMANDARRVLDVALRQNLNAFEPAANLLYARWFAADAGEKLLCVRRALRHARLDDASKGILASVASDVSIRTALDSQVLEARRIALAMQPIAQDDASGEILRIHAFTEWKANRRESALMSQRAAAALYTYLEAYDSPYRRGHDAETDVYFVLAGMVLEDDPANVKEAYQAIVAAERFAVLGIRHEEVETPDPSQGFVGGVVVPVEFPERLYPLWRLSAYLHVAAGDETLIQLRILAYLPPGAQTPENVTSELNKIRSAAGRVVPRK